MIVYIVTTIGKEHGFSKKYMGYGLRTAESFLTTIDFKRKRRLFLFNMGQIQTNFFVFERSDTDLDPLKNQTDAQPFIAEGVFYRGI